MSLAPTPMRRGFVLFFSLALLVAWWTTSTAQQAPDSAPASDAVAQPAADAAADASAEPVDSGESAPAASDSDGDSTTAAGATEPTATGGGFASLTSGSGWSEVGYPLLTLVIGITVVLGLIIGFRVNAFIALITAAIVVSLMAPGGPEAKIGRVAAAFGSSAGGIAIVIGLAAVIGKCMLDSGAADRIVRAFSNLLGEKQAPLALMGSGFVLAIPVFFDTVFYLLVPLARSLYRKTKKRYLLYILAIGVGGALTHTLVPPTPGPLLMASNLGIDFGLMMMVGAMVAAPTALFGLLLAHLADRLMPIPMRPLAGQQEPDPLSDDELPSLTMSLVPVLLPVVLISASTIATTVADMEHSALLKPSDLDDWQGFQTLVAQQMDSEADTPAKRFFEKEALEAELWGAIQQGDLNGEQQTALLAYLNGRFAKDKTLYDEVAFQGVLLNDVAKAKLGANLVRMKEADVERMNRALFESAYPGLVTSHTWQTPKRTIANWAALFGNANLALLFSTVLCMWVLVKKRGLSFKQLSVAVEESLMSGGVIILITAAGGAFGAMLTTAQVGPAIEQLFGGSGDQMSGTSVLVLGFLIAVVLKIAQGSSTVAMIIGSSMVAAIVSGKPLDFNLVYVATAIGGGSLVGSWMNDSGFWIFAKMGGLTEAEALKSWTVMLSILGILSFGFSLLLANLLPLTAG